MQSAELGFEILGVQNRKIKKIWGTKLKKKKKFSG